MLRDDTGVYQPPTTQGALLLRWINRTRESQFSHYAEAERIRKFDLALGIPVILLTTGAATTLIVGMLDIFTFPLRHDIIATTLSALAAVVSSLHIFLGLNRRAEKHRSTGARYGALRRLMEQMYSENQSGPYSRQDLDEVRGQVDAVSQEAPTVSEKTYARIRTQLESI